MDKGVKVDNKKDRKFGMWVMAALLCAMFFIYYFSPSHENADEALIQNQLEAIGEKRLTEAYYAYTSKDFQKTTSLEAFKKFLSNWPVLSQAETISFEPNDTPGKVQAYVKAGQEELHMLYILQKQDTDWKIQSIEVINGDLDKQDDFDVAIFEEPIKNQIAALKEKNVNKAYQEYTSKAFQESTSLKDFESFIKDFSVFEEGTVDYKKLTFENNIGTYDVLMTSKNGTVYDLKYDIIAENGVWKILQMQITESAKEE